jgi:hypothetical protein
MIAHIEERSERNLQNQEISLRNLHTYNFPHFLDEMAHYDTDSLEEMSNTHSEPIQYSQLCFLFLALLNTN